MGVNLLSVMFTLLGAFQVMRNSGEGNLSEYEAWKIKYDIAYNPEEDIYRKHIFQENAAAIKEHNSNQNNSYMKAANQFAALTLEEFQSTYLQNSPTYLIQANSYDSNQDQTHLYDDQVDWVSLSAVSPIKQQGACNSDYAFATVGLLEAMTQLKYGTLTQFSAQQLIDCSNPQGNSGCVGGNIKNSIEYIKKNGLGTEHQYPYSGTNKQCKSKNNQFKIDGTIKLIQTCSELTFSLIDQPVSVMVNANNWASYGSGIMDQCQTDELNHFALLVGMKQKAWVIKNQWGRNWGQNGYIRLVAGNTCGICQHATKLV